ncbi:MAG TPA: hypothetical protein DEQ09_11585 [Bacteroidales bacterium]|nr:hypothetical protein [Bacteroidales bacterium]
MKIKLLILFLACASLAAAQITAPGSSAIRYTDYTGTSEKHPVFIFCSVNGSTTGSLSADSPEGTGPWDFTWTMWDNSTDDFSIPVKTETAVFSSSAGMLAEGGYRVEIDDGALYDTSFIAWVFIDSPRSSISLQQSKCYNLTLRGKAIIDTFYYYDIINDQRIILPNDVFVLWSSDPPSPIPSPNTSSYYIDDYMLKNIFPLPLDDIWYNLHVTDSFGCSADSSFFYESIHVKAEFEVDPNQGEAPLEVAITDNSIRANTYIWEFGDDSVSYLAEPFTHTYYYPGTYTLQLFIESDQFCRDSTSLKVIVEPSSLNIPNVFTPDGDGSNEFFYVDSKSLRSIFVQIFSRGGQRVYVFEGEGDSLKDWQGWDGKIGSSKASPGVYYYIIRARGWDDIVYEGKEYRGFLYLFR